MMFMDNSNLLSGFLIIGLILIIIGLLGAIAFLAGGLVLYDLYKDHAEGVRHNIIMWIPHSNV